MVAGLSLVLLDISISGIKFKKASIHPFCCLCFRLTCMGCLKKADCRCGRWSVGSEDAGFRTILESVASGSAAGPSQATTPATTSTDPTASATSVPALLEPGRLALLPGAAALAQPPGSSAVPLAPATRRKRRRLLKEAVARRSGELPRGSRAAACISPASGDPLSTEKPGLHAGVLSARKYHYGAPISPPEPAGAEAAALHPAAVAGRPAGRPGPVQQPVLIVGDSVVSLGMSHDEDHTNCTSQSHIMSGEWVKGRKPSDMSWSSCSRKDLEAFLRSKASDCLLQTDPRSQSQVRLGSKLPGMNHSVNEQCRILFGLNATFCKEMEELMCAGLWCLTAGDEFCKTKLDAPLEGTECGTNKWCRAGECVSKTYLPQHEDGDWSLWSPWSICSRTCGTGVRFRQRKCDNPPPSPHGQPCPHASVEHGVCDGPPCPKGPLSFRDLQCRRSGTSGDMLMAVINDDKPCVLFCSSLGRGPPVLVADRVIDGTPCGPFESDLCVNGRCQKMGCDGVFGSSAQEDSCGVCDGKGHTCEVIRGDFQHTKGIGYVEAVVIPAGAWRIRVVEDKPSQSFLAVKDSRQNSINSNWKIELPGDFELAGTVVRYVRRGHWEKMSIKGPTKTPLHLMMLLFHNHSSALHYEYTMSLNTTHDQSREEQTEPEQLFIWTHSTWQDCSVQCGGGEKKTVVSCLRMVKQSVEIVNDSFCQPENRPLPKTLPCNSQPCHYRWTAGHWGGCSARCGPGVQQREVSCVQELQNGSLIPTKNRFCSGEKPSPLQDCEGTLCRMMWTASEWSECSSACGSGVQRRKVLCANPQGPCEPQSRPTEEEPCSNHSECYHWKFGEWSKCSSSCGRGLQSRVIQCMHIVTGHHGDSCPVVLRPPTYRKCYQDPCPEEISTNSVSSRRPG